MEITKKFSPWILVITILFSFLLAAFAYLYIFQTPSMGKRELLLSLLIGVLFIPVLYLLITRFLLPRLKDYPYKNRFYWIVAAGLFGILAVLTTFQPHYLYVLLPQHTLEISIPAGKMDRVVTLQWASTSLGDISFAQLQKEGSWELTETGLTHNGSEQGSLTWKGKTGDSAQLQLTGMGNQIPISVSWDNRLESVVVPTQGSQSVTTSHSFPPSPLNRVTIILITWFASSFFFLVVTLFIAGVELIGASPVKRKNGYWLRYILPMVAVWGMFYLTYYPGIITPDGINQWRQIQTGQFNDELPVLHTLLVILITRVWSTPASVILAQIIFLSLTLAWGISVLEESGLPRWAGWVLVAIFTLSPVNGRMVVTLWKDIPYSACLLLLSIMVLKAVSAEENGWKREQLVLDRVSRPGNKFISPQRASGTSIHIDYPGRNLSFILETDLRSTCFFSRPFYNHSRSDFRFAQGKSKSWFKEQTFLHHISAHIVTGGPLTPREEQMASQILPLDEWSYDCCTNLQVWRAENFSEERYGEEADTIFKLFASLAIKEPGVEANHLVCVSSLIWQVPSRCMLNHEAPPSGEIRWITVNSLGLKEKSVFPALVIPLSLLEWKIEQTPLDILFFTPALFLYLGLFCTALFALRSNSCKRLLFILPAVIQSGVMLFINVSRDFRYQYGVYLIGLFSLGLLFLAWTIPIHQRRDQEDLVIPDEKIND